MENTNNELPVGKKEEKIILNEIFVNLHTDCAGSHYYRVIALINKNYLISIGESSIDCTNVPRLSNDLVHEDYIPIDIPFIFYHDFRDRDLKHKRINDFSDNLREAVLDEVMEYIDENIILGERGQTEFSRHKFIHQEPEKEKNAFVEIIEEISICIICIPLLIILLIEDWIQRKMDRS